MYLGIFVSGILNPQSSTTLMATCIGVTVSGVLNPQSSATLTAICAEHSEQVFNFSSHLKACL